MKNYETNCAKTSKTLRPVTGNTYHVDSAELATEERYHKLQRQMSKRGVELPPYAIQCLRQNKGGMIYG